jgi:hypothetical protein
MNNRKLPVLILCFFYQCGLEGVEKRTHHRKTGGPLGIVLVRFPGNPEGKKDIRGPGQGRNGVFSQGDQGNAFLFADPQDGQQFSGFA